MKPAIFAPLRHKSFRLLFGGQLVSDFGDWLDFLALITLIVYRWDMGAGALATLSVTIALPTVLVAPVAGVWVDRWSRKTVMIVSDILRAIFVAGLIWAPMFPIVLVLVFLKAICGTFFGPARAATIPSTVPKEDLLAANSLSQFSSQISKVIGPALGGLLVAVAGPRAAFGLDAASFLVSALFLSGLPNRLPVASPDQAEEGAGFWSEFRAGFVYLFQQRTLLLAVGNMAAALFIIFFFESLGVLALKALGVGEALFGLAVGCIGIGTLVGATLVGQWGKRYNPFALMGGGQIIQGSVVALLGFAVMFGLRGTGIVGVLAYVLIGFSAAAIFVPYGYVLQVETPEALMGRVFASANGIQTTFQLLAPPLGAAMAELWGVGPVFAGAGAALAVLGIVVVVLRPAVQQPPQVVEPGAAASTA